MTSDIRHQTSSLARHRALGHHWNCYQIHQGSGMSGSSLLTVSRSKCNQTNQTCVGSLCRCPWLETLNRLSRLTTPYTLCQTMLPPLSSLNFPRSSIAMGSPMHSSSHHCPTLLKAYPYLPPIFLSFPSNHTTLHH